LILDVQRHLLLAHSLFRVSGLPQRCSQHKMCLRILRINLNGFAQWFDSSVRMTKRNLCLPQSEESVSVAWIGLQRREKVLRCVFQLRVVEQNLRENTIRHRIVREVL